MSSLPQVIIQHGMPDVFWSDAAAIYYDAFGQKLKPIIGPASTGIPILRGSMDAAYCITARSDHDLLGVAGYQHNGKHFVTLKLAVLTRQFGFLSGLVRYALYSLSNRRPRQGELVMDGIAVHPTMRGHGVGTRLLDAIYQFAVTHGYRSIRLDVIDSNPHARRLYERVGFAPVAVHHYPFLQSLGFTAVTTMLRSVH